MQVSTNLIRHAYFNYLKIGIKTYDYHKNEMFSTITRLFFGTMHPIKENNVMIV